MTPIGDAAEWGGQSGTRTRPFTHPASPGVGLGWARLGWAGSPQKRPRAR
jgi:hypothetical protein